MFPYHIEETSVSPDIALRMLKRTTVDTVFRTVLKLADGISKMLPYDEKHMGSGRVHFAEIAAAIWLAGRAQGIHDERMRRRNEIRDPQEVTA